MRNRHRYIYISPVHTVISSPLDMYKAATASERHQAQTFGRTASRATKTVNQDRTLPSYHVPIAAAIIQVFSLQSGSPNPQYPQRSSKTQPPDPSFASLRSERSSLQSPKRSFQVLNLHSDHPDRHTLSRAIIHHTSLLYSDHLLIYRKAILA